MYQGVGMVKARKKVVGKKKQIKVSKTDKSTKEKKVTRQADAGYYEIPQGYDIDTIVLMPVNIDTSFVYWEITDRMLNGKLKKLKSGSATLIIKVFEADCMKEVCSFEVKERIGKSYVNYQPPCNSLVAEIGIYNGNGYVGLLKSRTISSPSYNSPKAGKKPDPDQSAASGKSGKSAKSSTAPSGGEKEIWMTKVGDRSETVGMPACGVFDGSGIMEYYRTIFESHETSFFNRT